MSKEGNPSIYFDDPKVIQLCQAVMDGDLAAIDRLVEEGVNVNQRGKNDMSPLLFSFVGLNKQGLQRLIEHGAAPNFQMSNKSSLMSYAARVSDSDYLAMALARTSHSSR